jgi:diguanylate cyclase (GGDEF)-like protein
MLNANLRQSSIYLGSHLKAWVRVFSPNLLLSKKQVYFRILQGFILSLGAPLGWFFVRLVFFGETPIAELHNDFLLYCYLFFPTAISFILFSFAFGHVEHKLSILNEQYKELSDTDDLTGIKNVRYFRTRLEEEYFMSKRNYSPLSVAVVDIDFFKKINDTYGHPVGDIALQQIAPRLESTLRKGETLARTGGEEFGIILPNTDSNDAGVFAKRLKKAITDKVFAFSSKASSVPITISVGIASIEPNNNMPASELYSLADEMLYIAKETGRNKVALASVNAAGQIPYPSRLLD